MGKKTLYEFLGVEPDATLEEIKAAALHLANKYHPATYPDNQRVADRFKKIKLVYKLLSNPEKRADYDAELAKKMNISIGTKNMEENSRYQGKVIETAKLHWFAFIDSLLLIIISIYFLLINPTLIEWWLQENLGFWVITLKIGIQGILILSLLLSIYFVTKASTTHLAFNTQFLLVNHGFFKKKILQMNHNLFEEMEVKKSFLGNILNFGTIKILGRGKQGTQKIIKMNYVASPENFEKRLRRTVKHSYFQRRA
jgi:curved DNA-binding protein CbpA